jgi:hypothetical protein
MPYQPKRFQIEDLSRGALHDGFILGWDTGLGKTVAMFLWPLLKLGLLRCAATLARLATSNRLIPNGTVLLVSPGDLHRQVTDDGRELFKTVPVKLDSQAAFLALSHVNPRTGQRQLPPGYYLTSYTQLTSNGVRKFPDLDDLLRRGAAALAELNLTTADVRAYFAARDVHFGEQYKLLGASPADTEKTLRSGFTALRKGHRSNLPLLHAIEAAYAEVAPFAGRSFDSLEPTVVATLTEHVLRARHHEYRVNIGVTRHQDGHSFKCIYDPSLADLVQDVVDVTVADEGTVMKADTTIVGLGLRQIQSRYWLITSATPIKNRLPDLFWLAWRVSGGQPDPHARFPYPGTAEARAEFAAEFQLSERNLTREVETKQRSRPKLTPQVSNVHRLWKFVAPLVLRRRKADCGEDIVVKHRHVVRVPLGTHQARTYAYHLAAAYLDCNQRPAIGAQLQALRVAAANPASALLEYKGKSPGFPEAAALAAFRSRYSYIPKLASCLNLIREILEQHEQVIVFHTFHDATDLMSHRLTEAGVPHLIMDGRASQARRGRCAADFKARRVPVTLASSECMAKGHSFSQCSRVVHYSFPWAMDSIVQSDDRVHRINSPRDVHSFRLTAVGSMDMKMEAQGEEKTDAAELVLDGQLIDRPFVELSAAELLQIAHDDFRLAGGNPTVDEEELLRGWPELRARLGEAARRWNARHVPPVVACPPLVADQRFADLPLFSSLV